MRARSNSTIYRKWTYGTYNIIPDRQQCDHIRNSQKSAKSLHPSAHPTHLALEHAEVVVDPLGLVAAEVQHQVEAAGWVDDGHQVWTLSEHDNCKFMCTCEDPAFIACMSPLWQAGYSLVLITFSIYLSFAGIEIVVSLLIFSVHICVNIESTNYTVLVQCHGSLWSGSVSLMQIWLRLCFKTQQWN